MKQFSTIITSIMLLLIVGTKEIIAHNQHPKFTYKIELKADGYFYASMQSDLALSKAKKETRLVANQFTMVAPLGSFAPASQTGTKTSSMINFTDLLPVVSADAGTYVWSQQRTNANIDNSNTTTEYVYFSVNGSPRLSDISANVDIPLFKFQLTNCVGSIRMYRNVADASGAADKPKYNSGNSIYSSGADQGSTETYSGNYGAAAGPGPCPKSPDLITTIGPDVSPNSPVAGQQSLIPVTVTNIGSVPSSGPITEVVRIPMGTTFGTFLNPTANNGWTCTTFGTTATCTNSIILVVGTGSITFSVPFIPRIAQGGQTLTVPPATVSGGGEPLANQNNNTSNQIITPAVVVGTGAATVGRGAPSLTIAKTVQSGTISAYTNFNYTITVGNNGTAPTSGSITVIDTLQTNLAFLQGTGSGWTCRPNGQNGQIITCTNTTPITVGSSSAITLTVNALQEANYSNKASVYGGSDPVAKNKTTTKQSNIVSVNIGGNCPNITNAIADNVNPSTCGNSYGSIKICGLKAYTGGYSINYALVYGLNVAISDQTTDGNGCLLLTSTAGTYNNIMVSSTGCPNGSNSFSATLTAQTPPTLTASNFSSTNPSTCSGTDGTIKICNLTDTLYSTTYNKNGVPQTAIVAITDGTGCLTLSTLSAGSYDGFSITNVVTKCASSGGGTLLKLSDPACSPDLETVLGHPTPNSAVVGQQSSLPVIVKNTGTAPTSGIITEIITIPTGTTYGTFPANNNGWTCSVTTGTTATCTNSIVLAIKDSTNFTVPFIPAASQAGTNLTLRSSVSGGSEPTAMVNAKNTSSVTTSVGTGSAPSLTITKTVQSRTILPNTNFNYTLTVGNIGAVSTSGIITVIDTLQANLTFVSGTGTGWTCSAVRQIVTCTSSTAIGVSGSSVIALTVNASQVGTYNNTAYTFGGGDPSTAQSGYVTVTVNATPLSNLTIVKTVQTEKILVNTPFAYTLTVGNNGNAPTSGAITVTDTLQAGLIYVYGTGSGWTCSSNGQIITCTSHGRAIAVGSNSAITLAVKATQPGIYENRATASGGGDPIAKQSQSPLVVVTIDSPPTLTLGKTSSVSTTTPNTNFNYTLTVGNSGTASTSGVITVRDTLQANLAFVSGTAKGWICSAVGQIVTCITVGTAAGADSITHAITLTVNATQEGIYRNKAHTFGGGDPVHTNDATAKPSNTVWVIIGGNCPNITNAIADNVNPSTCGNSDGSIKICGLKAYTGGYSINYAIVYGLNTIIDDQTTDGNGCLLLTATAGNYNNIMVSSTGCPNGSNSFSATLIAQTPPTLTASNFTKTNPSTCTATDGSIKICGLVASTSYSTAYHKNGILQTAIVASTDGTGCLTLSTTLSSGTYDAFILSNIKTTCLSSGSSVSLTLTNLPSASSLIKHNPTTCGGSNGSIQLSGLTKGTKYVLNYVKNVVAETLITFTATAATYTITNLGAGNYTNIYVTTGGCTSNSGTVTLTDPNAVVLSVSGYSNPTTYAGRDGKISLSGLVSGTIYHIAYKKNNVLQKAIRVLAKSSIYTLTKLGSGLYSNITVSSNSCVSNALSQALVYSTGSSLLVSQSTWSIS